jgi:hypothetical protein
VRHADAGHIEQTQRVLRRRTPDLSPPLWIEDGFRTSWDNAFRKTSLKDLHFHDLRGIAVTRLALSNCSVPEIASGTRHSMKTVQEILGTTLAVVSSVRSQRSRSQAMGAERGRIEFGDVDGFQVKAFSGRQGFYPVGLVPQTKVPHVTLRGQKGAPRRMGPIFRTASCSHATARSRIPCGQKIRTVDEPVGRSASASSPGA